MIYTSRTHACKHARTRAHTHARTHTPHTHTAHTQAASIDEDVTEALGNDFVRAEFIRDQLVPKAVLYFTGEAVEDDDDVSGWVGPGKWVGGAW